MNALPDPRGFLRDGIDLDGAVAVALPSGVEVRIRPARCTPEDLLAGRASSYALAALRSRDAWVRMSRTGAGVDPTALGGLLIEAVRDVYDVTPDVVEAWLAGLTEAVLIDLLSVAVGAKSPHPKETGRARALVAAGFGRVPLSANEAATLADWSANTGRAPAWG
jgi:hypothetical protein